MSEPGPQAIRKALRELADPKVAISAERYCKTGKGEYAEGDKFLGIRVPVIRQQVKLLESATVDTAGKILVSPYHEERLFALLLLVRHFEHANEKTRQRIYRLYLASTSHINNWDLVDSSAPQIVGGWLETRKRTPLYKLAKSSSLWERRIAVLATFHFIRLNDFSDTVSLCESLLADEEDLMHKACGWMLREAGKRDQQVLTDFLDQHVQHMPRTMLRYSIEKLTEKQRKNYMKR